MHHLYLVLPAADGGSWRYLFESVYHTIDAGMYLLRSGAVLLLRPTTKDRDLLAQSDLGDALRQHTSAQLAGGVAPQMPFDLRQHTSVSWWRCSADASGACTYMQILRTLASRGAACSRSASRSFSRRCRFPPRCLARESHTRPGAELRHATWSPINRIFVDHAMSICHVLLGAAIF